MTMAPEVLEPLAPVAGVAERTNVAISEPIPKKMPMEIAGIKILFFIIFFMSAFSF
jgi:hypothetical protein